MKKWLVILLGLCLQAHAQHKHSNGTDFILEYTPYASVFALKAFGVESRDDWAKMTVTTAASWVVSAGTAYMLKNSINETRPDKSDRKSFPSGHTCIAFSGATLLLKEYGKVSPWIPVAGYGIATIVGVDRVLSDRHYWHDVVAGAGLGFAATEATWWLSRKVFKSKNDQVMIGFGGNTLDVAVTF
ncbi:MAG: phosphatase PAP2 family protein [Prevotella sp.]|nr:phosphatase PAP2 family protein [Prevotella sp.]